MNFVILIIAKLISKISTLLNLGHGSTWPGHIALKLKNNFTRDILQNSKTKIILITGTNGKTTTAKLLQTILGNSGKKVFLNSSGANLLNGITSSIILKSDLLGNLHSDYAIFEVDENALPQIVKDISPNFIIALNLFRDQLDRYGEIDTIARRWKEAYRKLNHTIFVINADDPQVAFLGQELKNVHYFGLNNQKFEQKNQQHASDSILCPKCGSKLEYETFYFSHLGKWKCAKCGLKRPIPELLKIDHYPLLGTYAVYDILAAVQLARLLKIPQEIITRSLINFKPAFGRQEIMNVNGKNIQFFLSKNPTSFNESLRTIYELNPKQMLLVLNDRIPDGTDVSWIWDIDFETLLDTDTKLYLAGDRVYDLSLRISYSDSHRFNFKIFENLRSAIGESLKNTKPNNTLYVLPTYSAMLDIRKVLTGKKIL